MALSDVNGVLIQAVIDLSLGLPIAHENANFTPPDDSPWLAVYMLPGQDDSLMKDALGLDQANGIFQISIYAPSGTGGGLSQRTADTILQYFKHGRTLAQNTYISSSARNTGRNADGWYIIDVSINYQAFIQRI